VNNFSTFSLFVCFTLFVFLTPLGPKKGNISVGPVVYSNVVQRYKKMFQIPLYDFTNNLFTTTQKTHLSGSRNQNIRRCPQYISMILLSLYTLLILILSILCLCDINCVSADHVIKSVENYKREKYEFTA
jgi:hypothetical protein